MMIMFTPQAIPFANIIRANIVDAFKIPAGSAIPTLVIGDHFLIGKVKLLTGPLQRGDVVVFPYPENSEKTFVKRIIGVGGDKIEYMNGELYINDQLVHSRIITERPGEGLINGGNFGSAREFEEQIGNAKYHILYLYDKSTINGEPWLVPADSVFVMGDNRNNSQDSRIWGAVKLEGIKGKAMKICWS